MGTTIRTGTPLAPRVVTYEAAGGTLQLDYCNFTVSTRLIETSRQAVKRIYRFSFSFVLAASDITELTDIRTECERILNQKGGILTIQDGGVTIYKCAPAQFSTIPAAPPTALTGAIRETILSDIEWGPTPISVTVNSIGVGALGEWTVDVTTPAEEPFIIGDTVILGVDAEVSYAIDRNHYTTRTVVGRVICGNWGRSSSNPFGKDRISQADAEAIRLALLAGWGDFTNRFMAPVRIPPNFERLAQNFQVDATETTLTFTIIDREVYRLYPTYITDADARMQVSIHGATTVQYVRHIFSGFCEAPRDVAKGRVLQACWEQIQDAIGVLILRKTTDFPAFVHSAEFTNYIYRNRIEYQIVVYTPYGNFDFFNDLAITNFRNDVFFPQMTGGSAQLYGSAYRLEPQKDRNAAQNFGDTGKKDPDNSLLTNEADATESKKQALAIKNAISFNLIARLKYKQKTTKQAVPNVVSKEALTEAYVVANNPYIITIEGNATFAIERGATPDSFFPEFVKQFDAVPGVAVIVNNSFGTSPKRSPFGKNDLVKFQFYIEMMPYGALLQKINAAGGPVVFVQALNNEFFKSNNDQLVEAVKKFMQGGQTPQ